LILVLFGFVFSSVRGRRSVELLVKTAAGANTVLSVAEKALSEEVGQTYP